jgi:hypothetical protein
LGTNPAIDLKHNRVTTLSRGVMFVRVLYEATLSKAVTKLCSKIEWKYANLDGCVIFLKKVCKIKKEFVTLQNKIRKYGK